MTLVYSKALKKEIYTERIIAQIEGDSKGPTMIFFGGLHGNEPAGIIALNEVAKKIEPNRLNGCVYAIAGNLKALAEGKRFVDKDLNRVWTKESIEYLKQKQNLYNEESEQIDIYNILVDILSERKPPFYFIDLHTTSSKTLPFITINDSLINRKYSQSFPVPVVLGIEEYLTGPLLSYINKLGFVSLGFESGQHDDRRAIKNAIAFINLSLVHSNCLKKEDVIDYHQYVTQLQNEAGNIKDVFEITYLHRIINKGSFKMLPRFRSFQKINKGTPLAIQDNKTILSPKNAQIFMPLYQTNGTEGFFLIRKIKPVFLKMSEILRNIKADNLLTILPGVSWLNKKKGVLQVNLNVAKYLVKPIFHLLGYRNTILDETHLILYNRERVAKKEFYKDTEWY